MVGVSPVFGLYIGDVLRVITAEKPLGAEVDTDMSLGTVKEVT